jgi:hypothetical protein
VIGDKQQAAIAGHRVDRQRLAGIERGGRVPSRDGCQRGRRRRGWRSGGLIGRLGRAVKVDHHHRLAAAPRSQHDARAPQALRDTQTSRDVIVVVDLDQPAFGSRPARVQGVQLGDRLWRDECELDRALGIRFVVRAFRLRASTERYRDRDIAGDEPAGRRDLREKLGVELDCGRIAKLLLCRFDVRGQSSELRGAQRGVEVERAVRDRQCLVESVGLLANAGLEREQECCDEARLRTVDLGVSVAIEVRRDLFHDQVEQPAPRDELVGGRADRDGFAFHVLPVREHVRPAREVHRSPLERTRQRLDQQLRVFEHLHTSSITGPRAKRDTPRRNLSPR